MPYKSVAELPASTKQMPPHAKRIFMSAFNSASKQYDDESRAFAVAFAAVKKMYRQDKDGKWHRMKETTESASKTYPAKKRKKVHEYTEADIEPLDEATEAWLTAAMPEIEHAALTEEYEPPNPREESRRSGIFSLSQLLACADHLSLSDTERGAITSMMTRLSTDLQNGYEMDEAITGDPDLAAIQEAIEQWLVAQELQEAGQRHRNEDYQVFDQVIEVIRKLRGKSPSEARAEAVAEQAEHDATDPTHQMTQGYHAGEQEPDLEPEPETVVTATESCSFQESITFLQEADSDGRSWQVCVIQAGMSKNQRRYSLEVLRQAAPLFEGSRVYVYDRLLKGKEVFDHLSDEEYRANPRGYAKDLVGYLKAPMIEGSRLVATLQLLPSADWLRDNLREAFRQGRVDLYGLSIDAEGDGHWVESGGQRVLEVDAIKAVTSVDVVSFPAAGGKFMRLVASVAIAETEERQTSTLVESLLQQLKVSRFREVLEDAMDEAEVASSYRRRFRAKVLAAYQA